LGDLVAAIVIHQRDAEYYALLRTGGGPATTAVPEGAAS
jgi:hypothetical protein